MTIHRYAIMEPSSGRYWAGEIPAHSFVEEPHFFDTLESARAAYASYIAYELKLVAPKRPLDLEIQTVAFTRTPIQTEPLLPAMVPEAAFARMIKRSDEFKKENQLDYMITDLIATGEFGETESLIKFSTKDANRAKKQFKQNVQMLRSTWLAFNDINAAVMATLAFSTKARIDVRAKMIEFGLDYDKVPKVPRITRNRRPRVYA